MPRPGRNETMMQIAWIIAERSTCNRLHVGCVFARDGRILVTGYNGAPSNMPHCGPECNESTPCTNTQHAEANGIAFAAGHGVNLSGSSLFVTNSPCKPCCMLLINAGVEQIFYDIEYRITDGLELLKKAGIRVHSLSVISPM